MAAGTEAVFTRVAGAAATLVAFGVAEVAGERLALRCVRCRWGWRGGVPIWIGISGAVTPYDGWTWVQPQWVWNGTQWVWQDGYWAPVR
jgi:hypothetical protein